MISLTGAIIISTGLQNAGPQLCSAAPPRLIAQPRLPDMPRLMDMVKPRLMDMTKPRLPDMPRLIAQPRQVPSFSGLMMMYS